MSLHDAFERHLPRIEAELQEIVRPPTGSPSAYYGMMRYHLGWADESLEPIAANTGKRIRPLLCLLTCEASGGDAWQALPSACAIELVHGFSLVHDDIEDGSVMRRGRRAVWDLWGAPHGINLGDGLFVLARMAMHALPSRGVPLPRVHEAIQALDRACLALCEGQYLDMQFEKQNHVGLEAYLQMIRRKTAALLAASAQIGAVVATDDPEPIDHCLRFGHSLGMAFQIQDDVLGIWGDEAVTGKSAATDLHAKKKTLPVVYALGLDPPTEGTRRLAALFAQPGPLSPADVSAALAALESTDARSFAEGQAQVHFRQALEDLDQIHGEGPAKNALRELVTLLGDRQA